MQKAVVLVPLLVLGWSWTLQGVPVLPEPLYPTQENFDLARILGTWYDVAMASTCPNIQLRKGDAAIGKLVLQTSATEGKLKATQQMLREGACKEINVDYELTTTPGRFTYHLQKWDADVDAYVVHTNYDEYAIVMMSKVKTSGEKTISVKLYSRTKAVRDTVLDDFKTLVGEHGMTEDNVVIRQDKGDCVLGEFVAATSTQPEPQRMKRNLVPSLVTEDDEGSGDPAVLFNGTESCNTAPETGPCFGMHQRYYYNSSSMSCQLFKYGGCLGNQNNFENERECLQRCRTEAVCRLPMVAQPCTGQPPIWAFDSTVGLCVPYKQGFCQGNANKFYRKAECDEYCGVQNDEGELLKAN
ncbi:protein AMBP-like [Cyclopterus lumpus]|uniref:protein AMBP-like n=1 Tax=Cyclopterus lumpus TaxID=8103 RepID=UPI0014872BA9|nr:protein AMBP-like [Cyclopterus lumpus]